MATRRAGQKTATNESFHFDLDASDDFESYVTAKRNAMKLPSQKKMLLALAWTTDVSHRRFCQYPHSTSCDVAEKLCNVQRAMFVFSAITPYRSSFPVMWGWLPSQARWSLAWMETKAMPALFPARALSAMELHITDGDSKLHGPLQVEINKKKESLFPSLNIRGCGNHFRERGDLKIAEVGKLGPKGKAFFDAIMGWIRSWFRYVETEAEYKLSRELLEFWLSMDYVTSTGGLTNSIVRQVTETLVTSFDPHVDRFACCKFLKVRGYDKEAQQGTESEISVLKRTAKRPNQKISSSTEKIVFNNAVREIKNQQKSAVALERSRLLTDSDSWEAKMDELHDTAFADAQATYERIGDLVLWRVNSDAFYVKSRCYKVYPSNYGAHGFVDYMVPAMERTRIVRIVTDEKGRKILLCVCGHWEQHGFPCEHQVKVNNRPPEPADFSVVHTTHCDYYCQKPGYEEITKEIDRVLETEPKGPLFCDRANAFWEIGQGESSEECPLPCFERSLPSKPPLIRLGNFWGDDQLGGKAWKAKNTRTTTMEGSSGVLAKAPQQESSESFTFFESQLSMSQIVASTLR